LLLPHSVTDRRDRHHSNTNFCLKNAIGNCNNEEMGKYRIRCFKEIPQKKNDYIINILAKFCTMNCLIGIVAGTLPED
jgi:hypothetical protein